MKRARERLQCFSQPTSLITKFWNLISIYACDLCTRAMLIFSASLNSNTCNRSYNGEGSRPSGLGALSNSAPCTEAAPRLWSKQDKPTVKVCCADDAGSGCTQAWGTSVGLMQSCRAQPGQQIWERGCGHRQP